MNKFFGLSCILLSFSLLSGCVTEKIVYENGREVVKTDDDDSPERSKLAADNRVKIAIRLLNEGQATMAKQNLQKALEYDPDNFNAKLGFAWYYQQVGETENAYNAYNNLMKQFSDNGDVYQNYGMFLCGQKKYTEAYNTFEHALTIKNYTRMAETLFEAGRCAYSQGDDRKAIAYADRALAYNSTTPILLLFRAELALGVDDVNTARIMMSRFSHYSEDNSMSLFIKLRIEEGSGDIEEAKKYGDLLLTRYPNSPEAKKYQNNDY